VFAVSQADRDAPYARGRDTVCIGPSRAAESYLDPIRLVQAGRQSRCTAVHPGWGFLAENPTFAALCEAHGLAFIGPPAHVMRLMGTKSPAKQAMARAGLRLIAGSDGPLADKDEAVALARETGLPVLLKAESGGGGRGMRVARSLLEVASAFAEAQAEARAAFGDPRVYLERLIEDGRHVEIQILADRYGNVVHLGERDCTIQRHHQKLIEESPAPTLQDHERERCLQAACRAAREIGYVGAGTMEFLLDKSGTLRFMEMNTRLQVEHCVSEMRSNIDLVGEQIRIAAGHRLGYDQSAIDLRGHAIECRINAEDPTDGFRPSPGTITRWEPPSGPNLRVDTHVCSGYRVPPHYDSLLGKLVAWGTSRAEATATLIEALDRFVCEGVPTTLPMHRAVLGSTAFAAGDYTTRTIPGWPPP
jgi:acetyl-CoA carboxylase biotin carboxylase subunit